MNDALAEILADILVDLQKAINETNQLHGSLHCALIKLLVEKGVFTDKEFDKAYAEATAYIDQTCAEKRDQGETQ